MFVRKKKNRSGTTSVVVVEKYGGRFSEPKTIGGSSDESEIASFVEQGREWIDREDDLRKTGFSKEGRHKNPQVILGLLVSRDGYPLAVCYNRMIYIDLSTQSPEGLSGQ